MEERNSRNLLSTTTLDRPGDRTSERIEKSSILDRVDRPDRPDRVERVERVERSDKSEDYQQQIRMMELEVSKMKIKILQLKAKAKGYEDLCESLVSNTRPMSMAGSRKK